MMENREKRDGRSMAQSGRTRKEIKNQSRINSDGKRKGQNREKEQGRQKGQNKKNGEKERNRRAKGLCPVSKNAADARCWISLMRNSFVRNKSS